MIYYLFCFLLLSTGFDLLAVPTPVGTLRISIVFFFVTALWLSYKDEAKLNYYELVFFILLLIVMALVSISSYLPIRSLSYIIWFSLCYFFYYTVTRSLIAKFSYREVMLAVRDVGRLQIILCFLLYIMGVDRPALLYYEPSYMVFSILPYIYFSIGAFKNVKSNPFSMFDFFLLLLLVVVTKSANLLLALMLCSFFNYFKFSFRYMALLIFGCVSIYFASIFYYQNNNDLLALTFKSVHESPDVIITILERTGNRWPRLQLGLDIANTDFYTGVGLGTISELSTNFNPLHDYTSGLPWNEPRGFPTTNVFIELLAEGGVLVLFLFIIFMLVVLLKTKHNKGTELYKSLSEWRKVIFIMFLLLLIESSIMRPYLWFYLAVVSGLLVKLKNEALKTNEA